MPQENKPPEGLNTEISKVHCSYTDVPQGYIDSCMPVQINMYILIFQSINFRFTRPITVDYDVGSK